MNKFTKLALAGVALLMGGMASAANVPIDTSASTGSSLLLLLKDSTNNSYLLFNLPSTVSDLRTPSQLQSDTPSSYSQDGLNTTGPLNAPAALNGYSDPNLTAYLSSHTGDAITWTIMGGYAGNGTNNIGQKALVMTSTLDQLNAYWDDASLSGASAGMTSFIQELNNGTFTNGVSTTAGWGTGISGSQAPNSFNGINYANGAALGSAQSLYLVSISGPASPSTGASNTYKSAATYTLAFNAASGQYVLSYNGTAPPVPVPAAIWLLGSGLMGLVGIGRRRRVALAG